MAMIRSVVRPVVRTMVNPVNNRISGSSWSSYWNTRSLFSSDGTIEDGKLKNLIGSQDNAPSLVDSYCLTMAVDDTIAFTSLSGWNVVSKEGTAVVEISSNNVVCTTGGSLYNLIMSDGVNTHYYPLSMGAGVTCVDTGDVPSHGTIVCADLTWGLQFGFHKNIQGYNKYTFGKPTIFKDFVDTAAAGIPDGWTDMWAKGAASCPGEGIVRCTVNEAMTQDYHNSVYKYSQLTIGQSYVFMVRMRASKTLHVHIRMGSSLTTHLLNITTDWAYYTSAVKVADKTYFGISQNTTGIVGDWFEFDFVAFGLASDSYYVPKRQNSELDSYGLSISNLGNGKFIKAETKLLFPDISSYQSIDDHLEFFYDRYGNQRRLDWNQLYSNPYNLDKVFIKKDGDILESIKVVNPSLFSRSNFIKFLTEIEEPTSYVYTKITKGALIYFDIDTIFSDLNRAMAVIANNKGVTKQGNIGRGTTGWSGQTFDLLKAWIEGGNTPMSVKTALNGCTSFDFISVAEEAEYATEVASGDLIVIDTFDANRGAYVKIDVPDFITKGTLVNLAKVSGTCKIGEGMSTGQEYSPLLWIPAGQSGVPSEYEEVPLSFDNVTNELFFRKWRASDHFAATFTNNDAINIYILTSLQYDVSVAGMTCYFKNARKLYDSVDVDLRNMGWLEGHPGELVSGIVASQAAWDAGMLFASSGKNINISKSTVFANQNNAREWCGVFGHSGVSASDLDGILNTFLPRIAAKNEIREKDTARLFIKTADHYQQISDKCDELGILFIGALDFIKNLQFNDYDINDFFKP